MHFLGGSHWSVTQSLLRLIGAADVSVTNSGTQLNYLAIRLLSSNSSSLLLFCTNCGSKFSSKLTSDKYPYLTTLKSLYSVLTHARIPLPQITHRRYGDYSKETGWHLLPAFGCEPYNGACSGDDTPTVTSRQ